MREKSRVQASFLLGPAGSGKTFRCLAEIRDALRKNPEGPPLILLAPKQATFQLERQLLADPSAAGINGYTRLHIFSFERLAKFVFDNLHVALPQLLAEEGRVMVLRALLMQHERELKLFHRSARRTGFSRQLSQLLGELQHHHLSPEKLRALASRLTGRRELQDNFTTSRCSTTLMQTGSPDMNCRTRTACSMPRRKVRAQNPKSKVGRQSVRFAVFAANFRLWLDGFAEMTPQELDLLAAILPRCEHATLAFCLENEPETETSWLSIWSPVGKTFQQCGQRVKNLPGCEIGVEVLNAIRPKPI